MAQQYYGGAIWTNHALARLSERGFTQEIASSAFNHPDSESAGNLPGSKRFLKKIGNSTVTIIAKQNDKSEWVIISCWVDPPMSGGEDEKRNKSYRDYHKSSTLRKIWLIVKNQLGLSKY